MISSLSKTIDLKNRAEGVLVGGVSASWNYFEEVGPIYFKNAEGAYLQDVDNNKYIDYLVGWGSLILGHKPEFIKNVFNEAFENGFGFQYETENHIRLAEKIIELVPGAEMVRLCNSGTEATMHAIRLARVKTNKNKVIKFEGHFHGIHDYLMYSMDSSPNMGRIKGLGDIEPVPGSGGIPGVIDQLVIPLPFNDIEAFREAVKNNKDDLAAIILEPISLNIGCIKPDKTFLEELRKISKEEGIVLIFDEVLTGFRVALGGAQELYNITPDLACFGKAMGCGMPVAALTGKKEFMEGLAPVGKGQMSGTNTGRILTVLGTLAALNELQTVNPYEHINKLNDTFIKEMQALLDTYSIPGYVDGAGGRIGIHIGLEEKPRDYRHIIKDFNHDFTLECFKKALYEKKLYGFFMPLPNAPEPVTFSAKHTLNDLYETLNRVETIFKEIPYFTNN
ncbi:aspartate aminotransferase family protein [Cytobacillus pseudoceanisediminis]|uniref:aspartate aminotransferase family protein n=1 Tax=Cytobacillus pseudoceanisediminis TaxID=3051614 RepID=UPI00364CC1F8